MKQRIAIALLLLASAPCAFAATSAPPAPEAVPVVEEVQVEMRASKDKYLGGEPIILTVVLRNNTSKAVSFLMLSPKAELAVRNNASSKRGKGRLAGFTGKGNDQNRYGGIGERIVGAHGQDEYKIVLSRLFDMTRAGTYTISGSKSLKLENPAPGGSLIGATKVARDVKVVVLDGDVSNER